MNIFWGYEDFVDILLGSLQNWAGLRVISMQFSVFLGQGTELVFFCCVAKISNIFLGCLKFLIFFWVNGRCWIRAFVCRKN